MYKDGILIPLAACTQVIMSMFIGEGICSNEVMTGTFSISGSEKSLGLLLPQSYTADITFAMYQHISVVDVILLLWHLEDYSVDIL